MDRKKASKGPFPFLTEVKGFDRAKLGSPTPVPKPSSAPPGGSKSEPAKWKGKNAERYPDICNAQQPRTSDIAGWSLLLERTRARRVVPFVGAGLSCPLLPGWQSLLQQVAERLDCTGGKSCPSCHQPSEALPIFTEMLREKLETRYQRTVGGRAAKKEEDGVKSKKPLLARYLEAQGSRITPLW